MAVFFFAEPAILELTLLIYFFQEMVQSRHHSSQFMIKEQEQT